MFNVRVFKSVKLLSEPWLLVQTEQAQLAEESLAAENLEVSDDKAPTKDRAEKSTPVEPLPDFDVEREKVIAVAQTEAKRVVETAQVKAQEIEKNAYEKGVIAGKQQGISEGQEFGRQEVCTIIDTLNTMLQQVEQQRQELVKKAEDKIIKLVLEIAKKVIREEVKQDRNIVIKLVEDGIKRITEREKLIIRVNRDDIENLIENRDLLLACADGIKNIEFQEDGRVESGGCLIETVVGTVDVRLESQISMVEKAFEQMLQDEMGTKVS